MNRLVNVKSEETCKLTTYWLCVLVLLFAPAFLSGQALPANYWNEQSGLSSKHIWHVVKDSLGFVWVATENGLNRFDGQHFKVFRHEPDNDNSLMIDEVRVLFADSQNRLWISNWRAGACMLNLKNGRFTRFPYPEAIATKHIRYFLEQSDGTIWLWGDGLGFLKYNESDGSFSSYPYRATQEELRYYTGALASGFAEVDRYEPHLIWAVTGTGMLLFDTRNFSYSNPARPILPDSLHYTNISAMTQLAPRRWMLSLVSGVFAVDYGTGKVQKMSAIQVPGMPPQISRFVPSGNHFFVQFGRQGLGVFDPSTGRATAFKLFNRTVEEPLRGAFDLFMSDGDYLWLRSGQGLSQIRISLAEHARFFVRENGFLDGLRLLIPTDANEYLLSFNEPDGLYLYSGGQFIKLSDLPQNKSMASTLSKESILFATNYTDGKLLLLAWEGATFLYDVKTKAISPLHIDCIADFRRSYVKNLFTDSGGNIWTGSYDGSLMKYNPRTGQCLTFSREQWPGFNSTFRFYEDSRRRIWVGMEYGIAIYDPLKDQWRVLPRAERIQSGVYQEISAFCEDASQRLWIGSYLQGMAYVQMQQVDRLIDTAPDDAFFWENLQFRQPVRGGGINSTNIKSMMMYNDTTMLIRTQLGISLFNTLRQTAINFGSGYGIYPMFNQFNDRVLASNYYTVALPNGFGFIDVSALMREPQPVKIPIRVTSFRVMEEERINTQNINFDTLVQLKHYENFMALEFELLDYAAGTNKRFWYKMEGVQDDWVEIKGGTLAFNNLNAGSYTLHLRAEADHSHTSVTPYRLHLEVAQAWWRSWWFRLVVLFAVGLLAYFMIRFYLREQELNMQLAKLEMKSLRSQMNPHFLFNSLNSINNYILKNEPDKASDYLQRFSVLIRRILNNSQYELISLSEELNTLKSYIEMEQLRFRSKFSYQISVDPQFDTDEIKIPPMLVQPYVENAIWHGILHKETVGYLAVTLKAEAGRCYIIVADNGVGRARAAELKSKSALKEKSLGMAITQNRIDIINQYYWHDFAVKVEDLYHADGGAAGTRVTISFKCS